MCACVQRERERLHAQKHIAEGPPRQKHVNSRVVLRLELCRLCGLLATLVEERRYCKDDVRYGVRQWAAAHFSPSRLLLTYSHTISAGSLHDFHGVHSLALLPLCAQSPSPKHKPCQRLSSAPALLAMPRVSRKVSRKHLQLHSDFLLPGQLCRVTVKILYPLL